MSPGPDLSNYNEVDQRVLEFRDKHPFGVLQSRIVELPPAFADKFVCVEARAYRAPDDERPGYGLAWEPVPGRTPYTKDSELQNAETSAWGRALIAVGAADAKKGIASANEVRNRTSDAAQPPRARQTAGSEKATTGSSSPPAGRNAGASGPATTSTGGEPVGVSGEGASRASGTTPVPSGGSIRPSECPHLDWEPAARKGFEICSRCGSARKAAA